MAKTRLSVVTALGLVVLSLALFLGRWYLLGADLFGPRGDSTWEVTLEVAGRLASPKGTVVLLPPPDFRRQHIYAEQFQSHELTYRVIHNRSSGRREIVWRRLRPDDPAEFQLAYTFRCSLGLQPPTRGMERATR